MDFNEITCTSKSNGNLVGHVKNRSSVRLFKRRSSGFRSPAIWKSTNLMENAASKEVDTFDKMNIA